MPPPRINPDLMTGDIERTMRAGLKRGRPDLQFPESSSDMTWCLIALLQKYDVTLRPIPRDFNDVIIPSQSRD